MKVLINSTAILSLTLYIVPPFAVQAQDLPMADVGGQQVICLPDDQTACPDGTACVIAGAEECQAAAEATYGVPVEEPVVEEPVAEEPVAEEPVAEEPVAEEPAAEEVAPEEAAPEEVAPEEVAPEEVAPEEVAPEETAPEEVAPEEVAPEEMTAEEAAPEEAAPEEPIAEEQATEDTATEDQSAEPATEEGATDQSAEPAAEDTVAEEPAAEEPATDETATEEPAAEEPAADETATEEPATEEPVAEETTPDAPLAEPETVTLTEEQVTEQVAQDQAAIEAAQKAQEEAAAAALADPNLQPVEAPVVEEQAAEALGAVLDAPVTAATSEPAAEGTAPAAAPPVTEAATAAAIDPTTPPADQPVPETATVTTETVTETETRSADQEFAAAPVQVAPGKKSGLSNLEKAGLVALGALAIGTIIHGAQNGGNTEGVKQVVQNTGDRVVVRQPDGSYQIYKDDNALLREPGSKVTTQTFQDGSTRTIVARKDGSQIATIRDASGRVLQRVAYDTKGRATVLIDDLRPEQPIVVSQLPKPKPQRIDVANPDAALQAALLAAQVEDYGAKFSLRQIRSIPEVRHLAPTVDVKEITFKSGSAALDATEARSLNGLGKFIGEMIAQNPGEVFLIEGHTDAVGSAASNLTLSDRRAETVAKALTQYFGVPPENMVVQGYGESELLIPTAGDERANRRVSVRIITPLLQK
ncbi:OmpA family protein [Stagnihabitans tardus]|uniref:OmpA family protein n=1 Tax=Stagnihabitans tardus TaxID=2699202 RepID=A0AAE4YCA9_9RHOB|nr:OmpA family protein [Stagnihabitans tardus]NBZ88751.1 OmpA family protein [Stagnihabitans tardus]